MWQWKSVICFNAMKQFIIFILINASCVAFGNVKSMLRTWEQKFSNYYLVCFHSSIKIFRGGKIDYVSLYINRHTKYKEWLLVYITEHVRITPGF